MNLASLAKLGWRVLQGDYELWARVFIDKYMHGRNNPNDLRMKSRASNIWQGISKGKEILTQGLRNLVGNGSNTSFWMDNRLEEKPLKNHLLREIDLFELYKQISAYWTPGRGWDWEALTRLLLPKVEKKLVAITIRETEEEKDKWCWGYNKDGS